MRVAGLLSEKLGYNASISGEYDLRQEAGTYSGTYGTDSFVLARTGSSNRARVAASGGLSYQLNKTQRVIGNVSLRNQALTSQN
jgi:hypothetical protein